MRAIAVLVPGSNGDGRPMAEEAALQAFAAKHALALVACRFTDKLGRSRDLAMMFYEDVLPMRLGAAGSLQPMNEASGFLGDFKARTIQPLAETKTPNYPTAWLPTARIAKAWQALVTEQPFDP